MYQLNFAYQLISYIYTYTHIHTHPCSATSCILHAFLLTFIFAAFAISLHLQFGCNCRLLAPFSHCNQCRNIGFACFLSFHRNWRRGKRKMHRNRLKNCRHISINKFHCTDKDLRVVWGSNRTGMGRIVRIVWRN